ncbi:transcription co-repressor GAL80 [Fusarium mundagurra]|uniref:Transcription co-repressor GAL80 n=1 Tax=Fusarium mundagurra TaxID=1567541 RepID=A0A8H6DPQ4_9HYPO|nr:transcription co-repressor GAL80 [Fusarium mundagurra]
MAPIRTAIIGLSSSAKTSWASNTHLQYLNSPLGRSKYQIVALQNSSLQAAKNAIAHYNLPPETKAYGTPEDLAADKDVELVVVATRVDVHHSSALPSVKAGKNLYVEWPLAQDVTHARELVDAAREKGVKTIVGLQGRYAPPIKKLREIIKEGRIGKVVSAELSVFDQFQSIIGDITNFKSTLHNQRPNIRVRDPKTNEITHTTTSNVPDLILATGRLLESPTAQKDAAVLVRFRRGQPFPGSPHLSIAIAGEKGEVRVQVFTGTTLHGASAYEKPVVIEVHDFERDVVEEVEWKWEEWQQDIPLLARGVAAVYEAFAEGEEDGDGLVSFEEALKRHEQLEGLLGQWDEDRGV